MKILISPYNKVKRALIHENEGSRSKMNSNISTDLEERTSIKFDGHRSGKNQHRFNSRRLFTLL
jgi:hypothetical protein